MVQARIHPYFPYFHVDVLADCVLFKPAAGHILGKQTGPQGCGFVTSAATYSLWLT